MDILKGLNKYQLEAVNHINGPLLIMAGAGSGKTKVLTAKIAYLLELGINPFNILAITFTNKAATEMKQRVDNMIGNLAQNVTISTFHSFCARFLRLEIENYSSFSSNFSIYDSQDSLTLVKNCIKELNLSEDNFTPKRIMGAISNAKNKLLNTQEYRKYNDGFFHEKVAEIYDLYEKKLKENNALDFDDLLMISVKLLENNKDLREKYQNKFKYILVDEYQDTNGAQYKLTKLLAMLHQNICVVGDIDQSIYGWRGADISNILDFEKDFKNVKIIKLEQNYRSTKTILKAANNVIEHNVNRKEKKLWTQNHTGEKITLFNAINGKYESKFVAKEIWELNKMHNISLNDIAILYRTNAQSRVMEETLMADGISYTIVGGLKFYDRKEIKDIVAYLRLIHNPNDNLSFMRIINVPKRSIGTTTIKKLLDSADELGVSLFDVLTNFQHLNIAAKTKNALHSFYDLITKFQSLKDTLPLWDFIEMIMNDSGYMEELLNEGTIEAQTRMENLEEFVSASEEFIKDNPNGTLEDFLGSIALITDLDNVDLEADKVTLMTMHSSKGLEFPYVFIIGMDEGIFPHARTLMNEDELEEERRTCYVGITRAEKKLYLSSAKERNNFGKTIRYTPSRFLDEIPEDCLEIVMDSSKKNTANTNYHQSISKTNISFRQKEMENFANKRDLQSKKSYTKPDLNTAWQVGDKAKHNKWGIGVVVSIKGSGEEVELVIAFPNIGIKNLMQKYAPISKV